MYQDQLIGDIELFAFDRVPSGWLRCEGQTLLVETNLNLFSIIRTNFGGNGTTTFCLPDLRNAVPIQNIGMHYCIAVEGIDPSFR
jgi:microcystin-dependent protein